MASAPVVTLVPGIWRIPLVRDDVNGFILRDDAGHRETAASCSAGSTTGCRAVRTSPRRRSSASSPTATCCPWPAASASSTRRAHSPGHISLLHEQTRLLITGDAIFNVRRLSLPVRAFCTDFAMTKRTASVLGELDYDLATFTHGPELRDNPREAICGFLAHERLG